MAYDPDDKKILEEVARRAEAEAEKHDEGCYMRDAFKAIGANARAMAAGDGPAQVATPAYRSNYETIFGGRVEAGQA
jgi:hypothetical protein